jgi:hypothetical protein
VLIFAGAALFSGYVPFSFSLSMRGPSEYGSQDNLEFGKRRVGEILFADRLGEPCHRIEFHNDTGLFGRDIRVRCDTGQPEDYTAVTRRPGPNANRLLSLRDAFVKR